MKIMDERAFKRPLPKQFYCVLLKYEEKATKEDLFMDELVQMTQMYGEIVSYYDSQMDPITYYFLDKQHQLLQQIVRKSRQDQEDILKNLIMANQSDYPIIAIDNYKQNKMVHLYEMNEASNTNKRICENIVGQCEKTDEVSNSNEQEEFLKSQNDLFLRLADKVTKKQDKKKKGGRVSNSSINVYQVPFKDYDDCNLES